MQKSFEFRSFLLFLLFVSGLFVAIMMPFFGAIFWAITIAILFTPLQKRFVGIFKNQNVAALTTLLVASLLVIIPFILIAGAFLQEAFDLYLRIQSGEINFTIYFEQLQVAFPSVQQLLERIGIDSESMQKHIGEATISASKALAQQAIVVSQSTISLILQLGVLLYLAFFVLRDSEKLVSHLQRALPLGDAREKLFFSKFSEVTRATVKGSLVVAMVQGFLGGFIFWALGIGAPILWGVIMTLLSLVPMVGASLVWLPVALYLFAVGDWLSASILVAFGVFVIGLVDNILRPILVGRDTKLPDYLVLLSTLGGFSLFGMNGFVIGPLIAALFITGWEIFASEFYADGESSSHGSDHDHDEVQNHKPDDVPKNILLGNIADDTPKNEIVDTNTEDTPQLK